MIDALINILYGVTISIFVTTIILPFIPVKIKERTIYVKKWLFMMVLGSNIKIILVFWSKPYNKSNSNLEDTKKRILEILYAKKYEVFEDTLTCKINMNMAKQAITAELNFRTEINDNNEEIFDNIEFRIYNNCSLRTFTACVLEIRESYGKLKDMMKEEMDLTENFCLICELNSMPKIDVILKSLNIDHVEGKTIDGKFFEIYDNKILYHDKDVHRDTISFIKKMIVTYS